MQRTPCGMLMGRIAESFYDACMDCGLAVCVVLSMSP